MRARRKRFIVISAGLAALVAAGLVAADWPLLVTHYHLFRLDGARTRKEALPHIDALLVRAGNPRSSGLVAASLGTRREAMTYWVFQTIAGAASPAPQGKPPAAARTTAKVGKSTITSTAVTLPSLAPVRPWLVALGERLGRDDELLRAWAHFVRWRALDTVVSPNEPLDAVADDLQNSVPGFLLTVMAAPMFETTPWPLSQLLEGDAEGAEAWLRLFDLVRLARSWTLGAPLSEATEIETPLSHRNALSGWRRVRTALARVVAWKKENRSSLRFDPEQGRCVVAPVPGDAGTVESGGEPRIPPPADPLPGWRGSVPDPGGL